MGAGGNATLNAGGVDVRVDGVLAISSGNGAAAGTAVGGNAEFRVNTLELGGGASTVLSGATGGARQRNRRDDGPDIRQR